MHIIKYIIHISINIITSIHNHDIIIHYTQSNRKINFGTQVIVVLSTIHQP
jgi:hypothetical protein